MSLDPNVLRQQFPMLRNNPDLAYLDSGASSQTPDSVIKAVTDFYTECRANVHRGMYDASEEATNRYEAARGKVAAVMRTCPVKAASASRNVSIGRTTT